MNLISVVVVLKWTGSFQNQYYSKEIYTWCLRKPNLIRKCTYIINLARLIPPHAMPQIPCFWNLLQNRCLYICVFICLLVPATQRPVWTAVTRYPSCLVYPRVLFYGIPAHRCDEGSSISNVRSRQVQTDEVTGWLGRPLTMNPLLLQGNRDTEMGSIYYNMA